MDHHPKDNNKSYVAVIGGANIDIYATADGRLVSGDSNPGKITVGMGGVGRNIADNLAKLAIDVKMVTVIGNDQYGKTLITQCQDANIDMGHVLQIDDERTSTYVSVLDDNGDLSVAVNDMAIMDLLTPTHLEAHKAMLSGAEIIVLDTNVSEENIEYIAINFADKPLFVDAVSSVKAMRIAPYLGSVHTLKLNRAEASALCEIKPLSNDKLLESARWFHDRGVKRVCVTLGAEGVFYSDGQQNGILASKNADSSTVNTSGAGDAFVGGLVHAWLDGMSLIDTVQFAQCAAIIAIEHHLPINPDMSIRVIEKVKKEQYGK